MSAWQPRTIRFDHVGFCPASHSGEAAADMGTCRLALQIHLCKDQYWETLVHAKPDGGHRYVHPIRQGRDGKNRKTTDKNN
jgi:hypothetical protein